MRSGSLRVRGRTSLHAQAIDPSGFRPNRRNRSASSRAALLNQRSAAVRAAGGGVPSPASARARRSVQVARGRPAARPSCRRRTVAGVGAGAQLRPGRRAWRAARPAQGGVLVAGVGAGRAARPGRRARRAARPAAWRRTGRRRRPGRAARPGRRALRAARPAAGRRTGRRRRPGRAAPSRSPRSASSPASSRQRPPVAGVGPGAQLVQVAALGQQLGQLPGGVPSPASARARSSARSLASASSPASPWRRPSPASTRARRICTASSRSPRSASSYRPASGGGPVAGVGPGAQLVQVAAPGQQLGQLPGGGPGRRRQPGRAARPGRRARPSVQPGACGNRVAGVAARACSSSRSPRSASRSTRAWRRYTRRRPRRRTGTAGWRSRTATGLLALSASRAASAGSRMWLRTASQVLAGTRADRRSRLACWIR